MLARPGGRGALRVIFRAVFHGNGSIALSPVDDCETFFLWEAAAGVSSPGGA